MYFFHLRIFSMLIVVFFKIWIHKNLSKISNPSSWIREFVNFIKKKKIKCVCKPTSDIIAKTLVHIQYWCVLHVHCVYTHFRYFLSIYHSRSRRWIFNIQNKKKYHYNSLCKLFPIIIFIPCFSTGNSSWTREVLPLLRQNRLQNGRNEGGT